MARLDRARFDTAAFPVVLEIQTRFDDLDIQGHVNNAAATVILQEARVAFNRVAGLGALMGGLRSMVASLTVEYAGELHHPEPVQIGTGLIAIGRTSFTIAQVVRQGGEPKLYAQAVMVVADDKGPAPMPDVLRTAYEALRID